MAFLFLLQIQAGNVAQETRWNYRQKHRSVATLLIYPRVLQSAAFQGSTIISAVSVVRRSTLHAVSLLSYYAKGLLHILWITIL